MGSLLNFIPGLGQAKIAIMAAVVIGAFVAGWKVESWRWGAAETAVAEANQRATMKQIAKDNAASAAVAAKEEQVRVVTKTITRTVDRIVEKPVYRNVCLDADGLHAVNSALAGKAAPAGQPDGAVPGPGPAQ